MWWTDGVRPAAHLHVRSGFSYGFGVATPEELVRGAAESGYPVLALTDRDGLYGIPRLLEAADEAGLRVVVGTEVSVSGGHVVLLARSMNGYRSLCRLITAYQCAAEDRRRPSCTLEVLLEHTRGLVCLTGAVPFGLLPALILSGRSERAREVLGLLREAFGSGNLFVELTDDGTAGSRRRMGRVASFAEGCGVPALATNEVAYLAPADHRLRETLVAASNLSRLPGPGYRPTDQLWLKDAGRMERLFADRPEALRHAAEVAERCAGAVRLAGKVHVPASRHEDPEKALVTLTLRGARERYGRLDKRVIGRLRREFHCKEDLGFAPYFLLALEAVEIAREKGVPVTGRGSAANSLVSYCLSLTQPEPFANRLLFERFMHEGREDPPDIDLDFCSERRDEVRDELMRRHSQRGVAVAATAATYSLRGAVWIAARALGHSPGEIDLLSRHVPTRFRNHDSVYDAATGWDHALREPAMRGHPLQDRHGYKLLQELSWDLTGRFKGAGTHNGGLVFGTPERRLQELVPLEPSGKEGLLRCQYDKDGLEYCGIPKLDVLGLKMHTALQKASELATKRLGGEVARAVAGFTPAEGDGIRRAMTRDRGPGAMPGLRREFLRRAAARGVPERAADEVFGWMEGFASYGFSKAHAPSFAHLSYASAYMRVHYPAEFFCALLNSQPMGFYSPRTFLNEARRIGVGVLSPDIHLSREGFSVEEDGTALRVGLSYSRGLSRRATEGILSERERRPFASVADLYQRTSVEEDALENLVRGGFLDPLIAAPGVSPGNGRTTLLAEVGRLPKKRGRVGQPEIPLPHPASWWEARSFASVSNLPLPPGQSERAQRAVLSLDVVRHPLGPRRQALKDLGVVPSEGIFDLPHGTKARAAGFLECLQSPPTRSGRPVWFLLVEDEAGLLQATIFSDTHRRYGHLLYRSAAFLLEGKVEHDPRRGAAFVVERIADLSTALVGAGRARERAREPTPGAPHQREHGRSKAL